ncbi:extracellular solute-binding protein [Alginatibacterium sediminis]|uniref:Extracellular solute-binding protein n=1 Tax=Alginatibacterium sediminis TaxID=2164068 RepID=A0A420EBC4_9ALTE|nr:extracellular solute-binding protein [Alginatibacterium sediminis]RKF17953.1 extracellular solute-binding protein [Alginatibacterium sediminis]
MRSNKLKMSAVAIAMLIGASAQAATTLEVSSWKGYGAETVNFPAIIERFEEQNPDIKLKMTYVSRNDTATVIPARLLAGDPPDVVMVDRDFMAIWSRDDQLMDLSAEPFVQRIQKDLQPLLEIDGKVHYMMLEISGMGMYVNKDLFNKAGVEAYPTSIDGMIAACEKLNAAGVIPMILPANNGGWSPHMLVDSMALAGLDAKPDQSKIDKLNSGEINFVEDEGFRQAMLALKKLKEAKCYDAKISAGTDPWSVGLSTFQSGRVAMLPQGLWNITPFSNDELPENYEVQPFPTIANDAGVTMDYIGPGWSIPKSAKNVDAAKKWIDFWSHDENLKLFVQADTAVSPLVGGTDGLPALASGYTQTRANGNFVAFPLGTWSSELTLAMADDIVAYMLDTDKDLDTIFKRWDEIRDNNL